MCLFTVTRLDYSFLITLLVEVMNYFSVFLVHPVSTAAVDGTTVEFTCTASNAILVDYVVNGSSADSQEIASLDVFKQLPFETLDHVTNRRNLSVTESSLYNNTEIFCRGYGSATTDSNTAKLTVQGISIFYF